MLASEREDERLTSFAANRSSVDLRALSDRLCGATQGREGESLLGVRARSGRR